MPFALPLVVGSGLFATSLFALRRARQRRSQCRSPVVLEAGWRAVATRAVPTWQRMRATDQQRLCELAAWIHAHRVVVEANMPGFERSSVDPDVLLGVAFSAAHAVLRLSPKTARQLPMITVVPGDFRRVNTVQELHGVARADGIVVVSADAVRTDWAVPGADVTIHEVAHALDHLAGGFTGMPELPSTAAEAHWRATIHQRLDEIADLLPHRLITGVEAFAVLSEQFFGRPTWLRGELPDVYQCLAAFYWQDPAAL